MILISKTESKFLDNIMISLYQDNIDYQIIDVDNIFMEYDINRPQKIFVSNQDLSKQSIVEFTKQYHNIVINTTESMVLNNESQFCKKNKKIALFLDGIKDLPSNLKEILFPKRHFPIHIFNCTIKHPQNAGLLNETEKLDIIKQYNGLISFENSYMEECELNGTFYKEASEVQESDILFWIENVRTPRLIKFKTYQEYIQEVLYE